MSEEEVNPGGIEEVTPKLTEKEPTEEYKGMQRTLAERDRKIAEQDQELKVLKAQTPILSTVQQMLDGQWDEFTEQFEEWRKEQEEATSLELPKRQPSPRREKREKQEKARNMLVDLGLDPYDPQFVEGLQAEDPLRAITRQIAGLRKSEDTKRQQEIDEIRGKAKEEARRELNLEHAGELKGEGGSPSGSGTITRAMLKDMSPDEYRQRKAEIDKAHKEGRIK